MKISKFFKYIFLFINVVFAIFLLCSYASPNTLPTNNFFVPLMGLIYPYILIINIVFVIIWFFWDKKMTLLSLLVILIGVGKIFTFMNASIHDDDGEIKVMSANIKNSYSKFIVQSSVDGFKDFFENQDNDIIAFQECGPYIIDWISSTQRGYKILQHKTFRVILLTKYEVVDSGFVKLVSGTGRVNGCIWADLKTNNGKMIRVYSVHMPSNSITRNLAELTRKSMFSSGIVGRMKQIVKNTRDASIIRVESINKMMNHIEASPYPTILMGDFNDVPLSYTCSQIKKNGYKDSFFEEGKGIGTTFRGKIPLLRIDYIYHNKKIECHSFNVGNEIFSDHYPIFGTYSIK